MSICPLDSLFIFYLEKIYISKYYYLENKLLSNNIYFVYIIFKKINVSNLYYFVYNNLPKIGRPPRSFGKNIYF